MHFPDELQEAVWLATVVIIRNRERLFGGSGRSGSLPSITGRDGSAKVAQVLFRIGKEILAAATAAEINFLRFVDYGEFLRRSLIRGDRTPRLARHLLRLADSIQQQEKDAQYASPDSGVNIHVDQ
tara:strand:+ start:1534 stop:1911 length:378 start_codon:yes stop_codon:yes gene_type:complete